MYFYERIIQGYVRHNLISQSAVTFHNGLAYVV